MEQLREIINQVLTEGGRTPVFNLSRNTHLRNDLGFDSLELAVLTVKLEAEFGVDVFAGGLVTTAGEVEDRLLGG